MMTGNTGLVLFAGLCLFSFTGVVIGEHTSPTASYKAQRRGAEGMRKGKGFLTSSSQLRNEMKEAVDEALGVGHGVDQQNLEVIRQSIEPMWRALHKNRQGRVNRRSFRYVVQDFFMQRHHLSITGLEANLASDTQSEATLLTQYAPNYVKKALEEDGSSNGFLVEDAVVMIAALTRLIEHSGTTHLEHAYNTMGIDIKMDVSREVMFKVMEGYILRWMMGDDMESVAMLEANQSMMDLAFDDWAELQGFAHGQVTQFEYSRQHSKEMSVLSSWNPLRPLFSFADAQAMVGPMALSFGYFWETECANVKDSLIKMDLNKNGRVKLSDFHGGALGGEWRFSESKEYLKQMGALDETSSWQGPRVIITNYLQAPSNCIITMEHFKVCCANECQGYFDELEESIGGAVATPEEIFPIIELLHSGLDEEQNLTSSQKTQLEIIAQTHDGKVPIHGRLFAQWMHYVFPLECPFPHKSGTTTALAPTEYSAANQEYMASREEMLASHASGTENNTTDLVGADLENEWMSQWTQDEELLDDLGSLSWAVDFCTCAVGFIFVACIGILLVKSGIVSTGSAKDDVISKSHFV